MVAKYNRAVLLFHLRQYRSTLSILRALMREADELDERVAMRVAFLTLEVLMHAHRGRHVGDPVRPRCSFGPSAGRGLTVPPTSSLAPLQALQRACAECDRVLAFLEAPHSFNGGKGAPPSSASAEEKEAHSAAVVRAPNRVSGGAQPSLLPAHCHCWGWLHRPSFASAPTSTRPRWPCCAAA